MQTLLLITDTPNNNPLVTAFQKTLTPQTQVQVVTPTTSVNPDAVYSPLTFNLPHLTPLFKTCRNVESLRDWVKTHLNYNTGEGQYWLPMVLTAKGPLYGEVIQQTGDTYQQPFHLPDQQRQPLYHLGYELLNHLNASPAVYSLQFNLAGEEIIFDRLFPFPHPSSIASLGIQSPDLLTCHWLCLTQQPILDLIITANK